MRKLKIWNYNETICIDLSSNDYLLSEVSGLGTSFSINELNNIAYGVYPTFDDITMIINYGIKGNSYNTYKEFMNFVISNELKPFILEYDYGTGPRYSEVYIKQVPKSQKTRFNVLSESVVFKRTTAWFQKVSISSPGNGVPYSAIITNDHFMSIPIHLEINHDNESTVYTILVKDSALNVISRMDIYLKNGCHLVIDSSIKKVYFYNIIDPGIVQNGYDNINHTYDTFIEIDHGTYSIFDSAGIPLKISYRKWVSD